jgi:putative acetyltransferase
MKELVREYVALSDAWEMQGGPPDHLPTLLENEISALPFPAEPPLGDIALAVEDHDVFATALLVPFSETTSELKRLYVKPGMRRNGVGRDIVLTLIALARELGYRSVALDVMPGRAAAVELYQSVGFISVPPFRHYESHEMLFFEFLL